MLKNGGMGRDSAVDDWLQTYSSDRPNKKATFMRFCTCVWNPNADIDDSGSVDLGDLVLMSNNYRQHHP